MGTTRSLLSSPSSSPNSRLASCIALASSSKSTSGFSSCCCRAAHAAAETWGARVILTCGAALLVPGEAFDTASRMALKSFTYVPTRTPFMVESLCVWRYARLAAMTALCMPEASGGMAMGVSPHAWQFSCLSFAKQVNRSQKLQSFDAPVYRLGPGPAGCVGWIVRG